MKTNDHICSSTFARRGYFNVYDKKKSKLFILEISSKQLTISINRYFLGRLSPQFHLKNKPKKLFLLFRAKISPLFIPDTNE